MNCVVCENCEVASDYPACSVCAKVKCFPNVRGGCRHCASMAEVELQSEGILRRLATIARLCNLAPDDGGEVFEPMTDAELVAMNARFAAQPEASF